jgi:Baseplate J-like protein
MMCDCELCTCKHSSCGCCEGTQTLTPATIYNRPGLPTLSYRVGTHGQFLESMKARLSSSDYPALEGLKTRDPSDFSITLLDGWATVGDVLSFYQERIATEGYLRTATERRSVQGLARLIGYAPRPGVSASVYLAYTLDKDQNVTISKGNRAQSVPGPGELPQSFETSEDLEARVELNAMKPRLHRPQYFALTKDVNAAGIVIYKGTIGKTIYLGGIVSTLKSNDLFLLDFGGDTQALLSVADVVLEASFNRTKVTLELRDPTKIEADELLRDNLIEKIHALTERFTNATKFGLPPNAGKEAKALLGQLQNENDLENLVALLKTVLPQLKALYISASDKGHKRVSAWLSEAVARLEAVFRQPTFARPSDKETSSPLATIVKGLRKPVSLQPANDKRLERNLVNLYSEDSDLFPKLYGALYPFIKEATYQALAEVDSGQLSSLKSLEALRVKAALFGHNIPPMPEINTDGFTGNFLEPDLSTAFGDLEESPELLEHIPLDAEYSQIKVGSRLAVEFPKLEEVNENLRITGRTTTYHRVKALEVTTRSASGFPFSTRVSVLTLDPPWLADLDENVRQTLFSTESFSRAFLRTTSIQAAGEALTLAAESIENEVTGQEVYLELDNLYRGLEAGRWVIVEGERTDILATKSSGVIAAELAMIAEVIHGVVSVKTWNPVHIGDTNALPGDTLHTFIRFAEPFKYQFRRDTVKIYGNVVKATHGETKLEILGAGDASKSFQTFALRQPPLTYLAAATAAGAESTLELRVNGVAWHEAPYLTRLKPTDRNYQIRIEDDGKTSVVFGDGKQGARLPTGLENVSAKYRSGTGKSGNVAANQISLLTTKPLGAKEVINPLAATGGADRESRNVARKNAPKAVKALDRLVSVKDYADFAESFAGIGKASAREISYDGRSVVHVTIAGIDDVLIAESSDLYRNLSKALRDLGDSYQSIELALRELKLLVIEAKVRIMPDYLWEEVEPRIRVAMLDAFGFEKRQLGQDVLQTEVLSTLQLVDGVAYVDLETLGSLGDEELSKENPVAGLEKAKRIPVHLARLNDKQGENEPTIAPAQLAILSPQVKDTLILTVIP